MLTVPDGAPSRSPRSAGLSPRWRPAVVGRPRRADHDFAPVITSDTMDEFACQPTSRTFVLFVGRRLGRIAAGQLIRWLLKDGFGRFTVSCNAARLWW
jgi:hypothetical protein